MSQGLNHAELRGASRALRAGGAVSEALVIASVAWTGLVTAGVFHSLTAPLEGDQIALDYVPEIGFLGTVVNGSIPVGALALVASFIIQPPSFLVLSVVSMLVVSTSAVMICDHMAHIHAGELNFWESAP